MNHKTPTTTIAEINVIDKGGVVFVGMLVATLNDNDSEQVKDTT